MFYVNCGIDYIEFATYREAEIFCGERGISCEEIYEEEEDTLPPAPKTHRHPFDCWV